MRSMGIDYGTKRVGIALSDPDGVLAFPSEVLENTEELAPAVADRIRVHQVQTVVIGESRTFRGDPNPVYHDAHAFAQKLQAQTNARIVFEPEYLTTAHVKRLQGDAVATDASAAAIILQTYLDKHTAS